MKKQALWYSLIVTLSLLASCNGNGTSSSGGSSLPSFPSIGEVSTPSGELSPSLPSPSTPVVPPVLSIKHRVEDAISFPYLSLPQGRISLSISDTLVWKVEIENGKGEMVETSNGEKTTHVGMETGESVVFYGNPISYEELETSRKLEIAQVGFVYEGSVIDYFSSLDEKKETMEHWEKLSYEAFKASFISTAGQIQRRKGMSADSCVDRLLSEEEKKALFSSSDNYYHRDWTKRDYLQEEGTSMEGFSWSLPKFSAQEATLIYSFAASEEKEYMAKVSIGSEIEMVSVKKEENGTYSFQTRVLAPSEFDDEIRVEIMVGEEKVSSTAIYSMNRALAKTDIVGTAEEKEFSSTMYSLAKSSAWHQNYDGKYAYLPPVGDNGIYTLSLGEYNIDDARMLVPSSLSAWGSYLYIQGNIVDSNHPNLEGEKVSARYENGTFYVTLSGAEVDGIMVKNGGNVEVRVLADSTIQGSLYRSWDDKNQQRSSSIVTDGGSISISCDENAKLNVLEGIDSAKDITIQGNVEVKRSRQISGIVATDQVEIDGNVTVSYEGIGECEAGICLGGNFLQSSGKLSIDKFQSGIVLTNESQTVHFQGGSAKISAKAFGITGRTKPKANHTILFDEGDYEVEGNTGIRFANVSVNAARVKIVAKQGFVIEYSEGIPTSFATTSGSVEKGEIYLINESPYNQWYDVEYVLKADEISVNGGKIFIEGNSVNGLLVTTHQAKWTFANCDVTLRSHTIGNGIQAQAQGEEIVVENTARIWMYQVNIPIACWSDGSEEFVPVQLILRGDFAVDGYKAQVAGDWGDATKIVADEGVSIRYIHPIA